DGGGAAEVAAADEAPAVGRRDGGDGQRSLGPRHLLEPAAVGTDRPDVEAAAAVGVKEDARAVRRPARHAVLEQVVSELPDVGAVRAGEEEVLLRRRDVEDDGAAVRRDLGG